MTRPKLLIETWLPIAEVGAESLRDNSAAQHPPVNRLHVWWARRPLTTSRAAILAGALPAWSVNFPSVLRERFPTEESYHKWFLYLIGVRGDPVAGQKLIRQAKNKGIKLAFHPYGGAPRAFTVNPEAGDLKIMGDLLEWTWGTRQPNLLDPFAGGGSIPFEGLRFGFNTTANDLNPVAAVILKATLDYPARFGPELAEDIRKWGKIWAKRVEEHLAPYFPKGKGENIFAYLWARTVTWKGRTIPLSPNWWLATGDKPAAVRLIADPSASEPRFEILAGDALRAAQHAGFDPDDGTIARGNARDPWTGEVIDGDYIKAEAQAGRMGQVLYAVALKQPGGFGFRSPTTEDQIAFRRAEAAFTETRTLFETKGLVPFESVEPGQKTDEPRRYGEYTWDKLFQERQLLSNIIALEELKNIRINLSGSLRDNAIFTLLSLALDKAVIYNNRHIRFDPSRGIRSVFDRHDFAFVWSFAEFDASSNLLPWVIDQVADAYQQLANMTNPVRDLVIKTTELQLADNLNIIRGSAAQISSIKTNTIHNITVDPPYYDNVMYAELADFFYVWLKRSVGHLFPEYFTDELTNKDDEAVANPARFAALGSRKKQLANDDYQRKMAAAFREMNRVLHPDGCLTVMFTHKKVEAWDTLASAIIGAGFSIEASWPVHTESEHSLHQAKKNAAASTILLACRKRQTSAGNLRPVWWDDLQGEVRRVARERAAEYAGMGISGADLYISVFGPTLSVISQHWPVLTSEVDSKTGQPKPLRPETALDLAREEVVKLRKEGLLAGRPVQFDPVTDWYLLAWDAYAAAQFPYDEARKLAVALGVDLDHDLMAIKRLASKKGEFITLAKPAERRKNGMVDEGVTAFAHWIDAAHTAMMLYAEDGAPACDAFLVRSGLKRDQTFHALLQAMIKAIPRTKEKGKFVRPEAEVLENMVLAFFPDVEIPAEEKILIPQARQLEIAFEEGESEEEEDIEE